MMAHKATRDRRQHEQAVENLPQSKGQFRETIE
jgi:hypothetical protein